MMEIIIKVALAYLLGSVSGSLVLGALRGIDIRQSGSGNAGGTNAFRTQGLIFALGVVVIDIGKGALAAAWLSGLAVPGIAATYSGATLPLWCGGAAVLGHCYPVFHGFSGGKGAGTLVGALAMIAPWVLVPMLLAWLLVLGLSGYVGLATVAAGFAMLASMLVQSAFAISPLSIFALLMAVFLLFTHRFNMARLRAGTEYRFERAYYKNWFK